MKKKFFIIGFAVIMILFLASCDGNNSGSQGQGGNIITPDGDDTLPIVLNYDVRFDANGGYFSQGQSQLTQSVEKNSRLSAPTQPTRDGYVFLGWSTDTTGSTMWDFTNDVVTRDMSLYAKWVQADSTNSVTLSFETNGGTRINSQIISIGSAATRPVDPEKTGYIFDGWYSDSLFTRSFSFETLISSNKTIYAKWAKKYTVTFKNYDDTILKSYEVKEGSNVTYDGIAPTKVLNDGKTYNFIGWDGNTTNITKNIVIKAIFEEVIDGVQGFEYRLSDDRTYYIITGIGNIDLEEVIVPTTFNNLPIKEIDSQGLVGLTNTKKIIIQSNIEKIAKGALAGASSLEEIEIPFVGLTKNGTTNTHFASIFGSSSFNNSSSISIGSGSVLYSPANLKTITINGGRIPSNAFKGMYNTKVSNVFLGEAVEGATYDSFGSTFDNWKLYIASSDDNSKFEKEMGPVTYFDAFKENIKIANGITYLLQNNEVVITDVDKTLTNVTISSNISINNNSYNIKKVGKYAFRQCLSLASITLPSSITLIDDNAFAYCNSLGPITLPSSLTEIGNNAFEHCVSLTSITLPTNLIRIGSNAFKNCEEITSISLNNKLEYIDYNAFYYCSKLTSLSIPTSVYYIGNNAFYGCSKLSYYKITSGNGMGDYLGNSSNNYLWLIKASGTSTSYTMNNNTKHIYPSAFSNLQTVNNMTYTLSSNLETIGDNAFGNTKFVSINLPSSVYYIGDSVFSEKEITSITLPANLRYLGSYAFSNCTKLEEITLPNNITVIKDCTFRGCAKLNDIYFSNNLTTIEKNAFESCTGLSYIFLSANVTNVGGNVFYGDPDLKIYIVGTEIPEGFANNFNPSNATIVFVNKLPARGLRVYTSANPSTAGTVTDLSNVKFIEGQSVTITATTNPGYTFDGWYDGNNKVFDAESYTFVMSTTNLSYVAKWTPNSNIQYKVEHYWQNIDNNNYMLHETDNLTGSTGELTNAKSKTYEGFAIQSFSQDSINCDGSTIIKLYYLRNTYTVELNRNNNMAGNVSGVYSYSNYKYGKEITISATTNPGYTFDGWYDGDNQVSQLESYTFNMPAKNVSYEARWTVNTNIPYKVEHYWQNVDNNNYTLHETDNLSGSTGELTNGVVKSYEGFTSPEITQVNIDGDGSTVIMLYYDRNSYTVTLSKNISKAGTISNNSGIYKFDKEITFEATTNPGYTFNGWYDGDNQVSPLESYTINMPANNISYEARWTVDMNIQYKVEHYLQNLDDNGYPSTPYETDNLTGMTDSLTNGSVKSYEGFTSPEITQVNINGDGSTIIKLFYSRKTYEVFVNMTATVGSITGVGVHKYGEEFSIQIIPYKGYEYEGIYMNNLLVTNELSYDINGISSSYEIRFKIIPGLENFIFGSDENNIIIRGVYDNTVTSIVVPNMVTGIRLGAFSGCNSLEILSLPFVGDKRHESTDGNQYPLGYIFGTTSYSGGTETVQYYYGSSIESATSATYYIPSTLKEVIITDCNHITYGAFSNCISLTNVKISDATTSIGMAIFTGCSSLKSITLPFVGKVRYTPSNYSSTITYFGYIFGTTSYSGGIEIIQNYKTSSANTNTYYIPSTLKEVIIDCNYIQDGAFYNCSSITSLEISNCITSIGKSAFYGCDSLENIYYDGTIDEWCQIDFSNETSNPMYYANNVYFLDENGDVEFNGNNYNRLGNELIIPNSITSIKKYTFAGYYGTKIVIPNTITKISDSAFTGCSSLESITLPFVGDKRHESTDENRYPFGYIFATTSYIGGIETIQKYYAASGVVTKTYYIPSTLREIIITDCNYIHIASFYNCSLITSIEFPNDVTNIGENAFYGCDSLENIYYDGTIDDWCQIGFSNEASNPMYYANNVYFLNENGDVEFNGNNYNRLGNELIIPNSITSIKKYTFTGYYGTKIEISNCITSIGKSAFYGCDSLENIYYDGTIDEWCQIDFSNEASNPMYYANNVYFLDENGDVEFNGNNYNKLGNELIIPNSITSIKKYTFAGYNGTKIVIPNGITSIGTSAFIGCSSIESITLPFVGDKRHESTDRNQYPFGYIFGTTSYSGGIETIQSYYEISTISTTTTYYIPSTLREIIITDCDYMPYGALSGIPFIESITIPFVGDKRHTSTDTNQYPLGYIFGTTSYDGGISTNQYFIGSSLSNTTYLTYYIPESLKKVVITDCDYIQIGSFYGCSSLTSIEMPNNVTNIGGSAFSGCSSLASIEIPNNVTNIGGSAFSGCSSLTSIVIPNKVTTIGGTIFTSCSSLTDIVIPNSLIYIGGDAFRRYSGTSSRFENLYYNGTLEDWCNIDFYSSGSNPMNYVTNIYFENINGDIEYNDKMYCKLSDELVVPNSITTIKKYAFSGFEGNSVLIPNSVTIIESYAFYDCKLSNIEIPNSVISIGESIFAGCRDLYSISIPFIGDKRYIPTDTYQYPLGYLFGENSGTKISQYYYGSTTSYLESKAYSVPSNLKKVIITDCNYLQAGAFYGCVDITDIVLPVSMTSIGQQAFRYCTMLKNVNIPRNVTNIGSLAFARCNSLISITIPSGITNINTYTFEDCYALRSIVMPNSVTNIGQYAFNNCSNLNKVYYTGTIEDWDNITFGKSNGNIINATIYLYSETMPIDSGNYWHYVDGIATEW